MHSAVFSALCAMLGAPMGFLLPDALLQPEGVRLVAQNPDPGETLIKKDAQRPKLWYAPVATRPIDGGVRIWYQRVDAGEAAWVDQRTLCVGDLVNGRWTLPALHTAPPAWGGPNNVCLTRSPHQPTWGGFNVFQLVVQENLFHLLYWDQPDETGLAGAMRATSEDGLVWEKRPGTVFTEHNDAYTLLQQGDTFWLYQTMLEEWPDKPYTDNLPQKRRVQAFRTSADLNTWSEQVVILRPDAEDPPEAEFYLMKAFPYADGFAGLLMKYYADPALEGKHSGIIVNELIASRDGRTWTRPFRDTDLGFWSYADPFEIHGRSHFVIWKDGGMETMQYGTNRLTAVVADGAGQFLLDLAGRGGLPESVNADTRGGWLELDVVDRDGRVQEHFGRCRIEGLEMAAIPLRWKDGTLEAGLHLRIRMEASKLFAVGWP